MSFAARAGQVCTLLVMAGVIVRFLWRMHTKPTVVDRYREFYEH